MLTVEEFDGYAVLNIGNKGKAGTESLCADIIAMTLDGGIPFTALQLDHDAVGDIELLLADILDTVHQLAGDAFVDELGGPLPSLKAAEFS